MAETKTPDAVALLKADHRKVEELFADLRKRAATARKQKIAEEICMELTVHADDRGRNLLSGVRGQGRGRSAEGSLCRA